MHTCSALSAQFENELIKDAEDDNDGRELSKCNVFTQKTQRSLSGGRVDTERDGKED